MVVRYIKSILTLKSLLLLIIISIIAGTGWFLYNTKNLDTKSPFSDPYYHKLRIDSEPTGVSMQADQFCDSERIHKTTPYTCSIPEQSKDVSITAPDKLSKDGRNYTFRTWDGCSESNASKNICKITLDSDTQKTIKATYDEVNSQKSVTPKSTPSSSIKCNGQLIENNQKCRFIIEFGTNRMPGRLTVYAVQTDPLNQLYQEITFTAECSVHDACINEAYGQGQQRTTGKVVSPRIDFTIDKPTSIIVDAPVAVDYGTPNRHFTLTQWVYYPAGVGVSTYYDALRSEYTNR